MAASDSAASTNYAAKGIVILPNLLTPAEVGVLRQRMRDIEEGRVSFPHDLIEYEPTADAGAIRAMRKINRCAENDKLFMAHARNPKILNIIADLIGPDIKLFSSQCFMKPPGGLEKPWHQDSAYFPIEPKGLVTCWTALDDVTNRNGCLWVVPGSHQGPLLNHRQPWLVGDRVDMQIPADEIDADRAIAVTMPAGSCSFHHSMLLHRSGPNETQQSRRGLAVHYMSSQSRWIDDSQPQPEFLLLRGRSYEGCV